MFQSPESERSKFIDPIPALETLDDNDEDDVAWELLHRMANSQPEAGVIIPQHRSDSDSNDEDLIHLFMSTN